MSMKMIFLTPEEPEPNVSVFDTPLEIPALPAGQYYLVDDVGDYLIDDSGKYLISTT